MDGAAHDRVEDPSNDPAMHRDVSIVLRFLRFQRHLDAAVINPVEGEIDQMTDGRQRKLASKHGVEEISPAHRLTRFSQGTGIVPMDNALAPGLRRCCWNVDQPAKTTLPNGRSSVRWRKASPASWRG
jgi:hypothetical protein